MISEIQLKNYKSVVDVSLPLGRFNLLIGANGCGKSNILEGIAVGAAASSDKLDYEYFTNRGIRVVEPRFMLPAFENVNSGNITISIVNDKDIDYEVNIKYNNAAKPARWEDNSVLKRGPVQITKLDLLLAKNYMKSQGRDIVSVLSNREQILDAHRQILDNQKQILEYDYSELNGFLIYSLEETRLRQADDSNRTYPLGLHGEGLFSHLKDLAQRTDGIAIFDEIKENLKVLDWFDDMQVPSEQLSNEFKLKLKDNYLAETINTFDQRSTNEGFLYLLFYLTLVISDETPRFFAIENIDTAFNPKLCREVTRRLTELARKHNKQIIATTHNAAVLDGMDINTDDVRLHVVRRTIDGYTITNRVILKENMTMSLSEAWLKGMIGGLPDNF